MTDAIISPTPERLAKHSDWETPQSDRKTRRQHHRMIGVIEGMHRRGWIRDEQRNAFALFDRHLAKADRVHVPMCQYGRPFVGGDDSPWDPLDIKADAIARVRAATAAIGHEPTARALAIAALRECTLEDIGRSICGEGNKTAAIGAAKIMLQIGTHRLAVHYQLVRGP